MTEDELVEQMTDVFFDEGQSEDYVSAMRAALALARPIIEREAFEKAAKVADDEDQKSAFKFGAGEHVRKPSGYAFDGIVRSAFMVSGGDRYVVESEASPGLLHIFNGSQLERKS